MVKHDFQSNLRERKAINSIFLNLRNSAADCPFALKFGVMHYGSQKAGQS